MIHISRFRLCRCAEADGSSADELVDIVLQQKLKVKRMLRRLFFDDTGKGLLLPVSADKKLFTPGPLSCSRAVKEAMLRDFGSRDAEFTEVIREVRKGLLQVAGVSEPEWTAVLLQGSGTYCVEAAVHTTSPRTRARVLVLSNGAYGHRLIRICQAADIPHNLLDFGEAQPFDMARVRRVLRERPGRYTAVAAVHCETSCGLLNPVAALGQEVRAAQPTAAYIVDAMSSFGAFPLPTSCADLLVASANKCLQGVPGFGLVLARAGYLLRCQGNARTLSLDLVSQNESLDTLGQFRFTPPTHALLAAQEALAELEREGGPRARAARYEENAAVLLSGMRGLGFRTLLPESLLCPVITSFHCPQHPSFSFAELYRCLSDLGQVIYPGKVTGADCFRVGCIGDLHPDDITHLVACVRQVLGDMGVPVPVP